jgi:hypothetical protein
MVKRSQFQTFAARLLPGLDGGHRGVTATSCGDPCGMSVAFSAVFVPPDIAQAAVVLSSCSPFRGAGNTRFMGRLVGPGRLRNLASEVELALGGPLAETGGSLW